MSHHGKSNRFVDRTRCFISDNVPGLLVFFLSVCIMNRQQRTLSKQQPQIGQWQLTFVSDIVSGVRVCLLSVCPSAFTVVQGWC